MTKILIDTDVVLDFFFDRQPYADDAALIFSLCENKQLLGFVTPVIFSNSYHLLRRTARHAKVIEKLKQLFSVLDVLAMDKKVENLALASGFNDFEDALQNFSAVLDGQIDAIVTRNVKDFKKSEIGILTPENFLKTFI